jgi:hypothetical protein
LGNLRAASRVYWLPSFFVRSYGLSLRDVSLLYGAVLLIGGIGKIEYTQWISKQEQRNRKLSLSRAARKLWLCGLQRDSQGDDQRHRWHETLLARG